MTTIENTIQWEIDQLDVEIRFGQDKEWCHKMRIPQDDYLIPRFRKKRLLQAELELWQPKPSTPAGADNV